MIALLLAWQSWVCCMTGPNPQAFGFAVGVNVGSKYDLDRDGDLDLLDWADYAVTLSP